MAVSLLHSRADRRTDVRKEMAGAHVAGKLVEISVVPRRLDAMEDTRLWLIVIPADAEAVAVGRLGAESRMQALVDQRVSRGIQRVLQQDR
jgi:hypothetical protein